METRLQSGARVAPAGDTARQFVIERSHSANPMTEKMLALLPVSAWVEPYPRPSTYPCNCAHVWKITESSSNDLAKTFEYPELLDGTPNLICFCHSHFIE